MDEKSHLVTRHTKKEKKELAKRMMTEWKDFCSSFYKEYEDTFYEYIKNQKFDYSKEPGVLYFKSTEPLGMIMDRKFRIFESNVARLVVLGKPDNFRIISAYPERNTTVLFKEKYNFSDFEWDEYSEEDICLFAKLRDRGYKCVAVNNSVKVFLPNTVVRIRTSCKEMDMELKKKPNEERHRVCTIKYENQDTVFILIKLIEGYKGEDLF